MREEEGLEEERRGTGVGGCCYNPRCLQLPGQVSKAGPSELHSSVRGPTVHRVRHIFSGPSLRTPVC